LLLKLVLQCHVRSDRVTHNILKQCVATPDFSRSVIPDSRAELQHLSRPIQRELKLTMCCEVGIKFGPKLTSKWSQHKHNITVYKNGRYVTQCCRSQYSEGPATSHLDTGFSWFPCVYKQMLRWFTTFQVATTCLSCGPPDFNLVVTNFIFCIHVK